MMMGVSNAIRAAMAVVILTTLIGAMLMGVVFERDDIFGTVCIGIMVFLCIVVSVFLKVAI